MKNVNGGAVRAGKYLSADLKNLIEGLRIDDLFEGTGERDATGFD